MLMMWLQMKGGGGGGEAVTGSSRSASRQAIRSFFDVDTIKPHFESYSLWQTHCQLDPLSLLLEQLLNCQWNLNSTTGNQTPYGVTINTQTHAVLHPWSDIDDAKWSVKYAMHWMELLIHKRTRGQVDRCLFSVFCNWRRALWSKHLTMYIY